MSTIVIGNDHAGYRLKLTLARHLRAQGYDVVDLGHQDETSTDYPVYAVRVAQAVAAGEAAKGLLICGTGVGISITANKVRGIRAVCCSEPYSATLSRLHNDTNILALGARVVGDGLATQILDAWLGTPFEGGRHAERIALIGELENAREAGVTATRAPGAPS